MEHTVSGPILAQDLRMLSGIAHVISAFIISQILFNASQLAKK